MSNSAGFTINWRDVNFRKFILSVAIAIAAYIFFPESMLEPARRVASIFILAALLWAFEAVPLFATSILVVLLQIFSLSIFKKGLILEKVSYSAFLEPFGSPIIILFFGGFILAKALNKYGIDRFIATKLLSMTGNKPYSLMAGFMFTTAFLSMWMSNTATTAMMVAMVMPLLAQLEEDDPFRTGLLLAIAFSASIGGMGTPVGTPPNAIAIGILANAGIQVDFISWMKMAIPLTALLLVIISWLLIKMFPPKRKAINFNITSTPLTDTDTKLTIIIAVVVIILWLTSGLHNIPSAVIALLGAGVFAVTGLLNQKDLNSINWDVLILMWGGLALGKGMEVSGLAEYIVALPLFQQSGLVLIILFCLLAVFLSTLISNTATANLLIPIVMVIPGQSTVMLATTIALCCSLAMALPVSTPPNAIIFSSNMLKSKDMFKAGIIISIVSVFIIIIGFKFVITNALGLE